MNEDLPEEKQNKDVEAPTYAPAKDSSPETGTANPEETKMPNPSEGNSEIFVKLVPALTLGAMAIYPILSAWFGSPQIGLTKMPPIFIGISATGIISFLTYTIFLRTSEFREVIVSSFVLVALTLIGVTGENEPLSRLFWLLESGHFIPDNRHRWEAVAVASTFYMAAIYLGSLSDLSSEKKHERRAIDAINTLTMASAGLTASAFILLHKPMTHLVLIFITGVLFCIIDWVVQKNFLASSHAWSANFAKESKKLLKSIDLPITVGLGIIVVYSAINMSGQCPISLDSSLGEVAQQGIGNVKELIAHPCVEIYPLVAGAIAFHMIAFNVLYLFSMFDFDKIFFRRNIRGAVKGQS